MIRIIYDPAAESGGALTVLNNYHRKALKDTTCKSIFVTSAVKLTENENVINIRLPWVKKSWFHRLYCDCIYAPRLIKKMKAEEVLSLQNMTVPLCKVKQTVYVHNAIPFAEIKFNFRTDKLLWVYQNLIGRLTVSSLKKADKIIVQTEWMKKAVTEKCNIPDSTIQVERVEVEKPETTEREETTQTIFFYPATPLSFKNHKIILEASKLLKKSGIDNYKIVFTIDPQMSGIASDLYAQAKECALPIEFVGLLNKERMNNYYRKSVLIFPSYLETVGLPILEAKQFDCFIIAADCLYAHDAMAEYKRCLFFDYIEPRDLSNKMKMIIEQKKIQ